MAVSEQQRNVLMNRLRDVIGEEAAGTLLSLLPMSGWDDVVREPDLRAATAELRAQTFGVRAEMGEGFARVDARFAEVEARMDTRFAEVEARMDTGFAELRQALAESGAATRNWMITMMVGVAALTSTLQLVR